MRKSINGWLGLSMIVTGCGAVTPAGTAQPILLSSQALPGLGLGYAPNPAFSLVDRGPGRTASGMVSGPGSLWAARFADFAMPSQWAALAAGFGRPAGPVATPGWDPLAMTTASPWSGLGQGGLTTTTPSPGWGNGSWGTATRPGQYNLSRGATDIGGWGIDSGFFTIPQTEQRRQLDAALATIDAGPSPVGGGGATRLDPKKFPFLRPVKGPLIPPTK
jgi:hypothetical protein